MGIVRKTAGARGAPSPAKQAQAETPSLAAQVRDLAQSMVRLAEKVSRIERREREKRTIGFHTDCYSLHDAGDGEEAWDTEAGCHS